MRGADSVREQVISDMWRVAIETAKFGNAGWL